MADRHDEAAREILDDAYSELRQANDDSMSDYYRITRSEDALAEMKAAEARIAAALRTDAERIAALEAQVKDLCYQKSSSDARADEALAAMDRFVAACHDSPKRVADLEQALARGIARACAECDSKGRWCERCDLATGYRAVLLATESGRAAFDVARAAIQEEDANG